MSEDLFVEKYESELKQLANSVATRKPGAFAGAAAALLTKGLTGSSVAAGAAEAAIADAFGTWWADTPDARLLAAAEACAKEDRDAEALVRFAEAVRPALIDGLRSAEHALTRLEEGQAGLSSRLDENCDVLAAAMGRALDGLAQVERGHAELKALLYAILRNQGRLPGAHSGPTSTPSTPPVQGEGVPRVFLSHRAADHGAAEALGIALMEEHGIEVWYDGWEIVGGDNIVAKMSQGLRDAHGALLFIGRSGIGDGWMHEEASAALLRTVDDRLLPTPPFLIPVLEQGLSPDQLRAWPLIRTRKSLGALDVESIARAIWHHCGRKVAKPRLGTWRP